MCAVHHNSQILNIWHYYPALTGGAWGVGRCQFAVFGNPGVWVDSTPNPAPKASSGLLAQPANYTIIGFGPTQCS